MVESIALGSFVSDTCVFPLLRHGVGGQGRGSGSYPRAFMSVSGDMSFSVCVQGQNGRRRTGVD